jgi:hypothetical protein
MTEGVTVASAARNEPVGIGGWLILPIIGILLTPLRALSLIGTYSEMSEAMPYLSTAQKVFVTIEILVNAVFMVIAPIVLLILLFKRMALFPRVFIIWGLANIAFLVLDLIGAQALFGEVMAQTGTPLFDAETVKEFGRGIVLSLVWVPYMALSRRVKNTFVN